MSAIEIGDPISFSCNCQQGNAAGVTVYDLLQMQRHVHGVERSQPQDAHNEGEHSKVRPASKRRRVVLSTLAAVVVECDQWTLCGAKCEVQSKRHRSITNLACL